MNYPEWAKRLPKMSRLDVIPAKPAGTAEQGVLRAKVLEFQAQSCFGAA